MTGPADANTPAATPVDDGCADTGVDCDEVLAQLQRFIDGEVGPEAVADVREHLAACYPCADRAEFERQFRMLIRSRCEQEAAPPGLLERIRTCLDDTDVAPTGG